MCISLVKILEEMVTLSNPQESNRQAKQLYEPENTSDELITCYTNIGCIIHSGVPCAKLRRIQGNLAEQEQEFDFSLKLVSFNNDKLTHLTTGGGMPFRVRITQLRQGNSGFYVTGKITKKPISDFDRFGKSRGVAANELLQQWFQPGYQVHFLHRGAGTDGLVINIVNHDDKTKLRFRTKNL